MIQKTDIDPLLLKKNKRYFYLVYGSVFLTFLIFFVNPLISLVYLILLISGIYFLSLRATKNQANFNCIRCGLCCAPSVTPTEKDVRRIEKHLGKSREFFLENNSLKKVNGYCMFLKNERGENICSIYNARPSICRRWPFHKKWISWKWFMICPALRNTLKSKMN